MTQCAQISTHEDVNNGIATQRPTSRPINTHGKRKTNGWVPKSTKSTVNQASLGLDTFPLNHYDWSEDYQLMHEKLLTRSLAPCLGGNISMNYLNEIINWIIAPIYKTGSDLIQPFSFQACCIASGVDVSELQAQVFPQLQNALDNVMKN